MSEQHPAVQSTLTGEEALRDAVSRRLPVEVFLADDPSRIPARGQFLACGEGGLVIEELQIIGVDLDVDTGVPVEGYFRCGSLLFRFDTEVIDVRGLAKLEGTLAIGELALQVPQKIVPGQRRSVFRVGTGARHAVPVVSVWREECPIQPESESGVLASGAPPGEPDHQGIVLNASDSGFSLLLESCRHTTFQAMQHLCLSVDLREGDPPFVFRCTVRHASPVRDIDTRLGVQLTDDGTRGFARRVRILSRFIAAVQREQLR